MNEDIRTQVVIIGGGPAGMAAARELTQVGVETLILDEGQRLGGQIFRQAPDDYRGESDSRYVSPSHAVGHKLIEAVTETSIPVRSAVNVFEITADRVWAETHDGSLSVRADRVILATGAMDRCLPFPGWTLPGVITAGAAQVMVRGQMLRPGNRAVVAGTGPLLLPTVTALLGAGVDLVGLFDANRALGFLKTLPSVLSNGHRRREALHYMRRLLGAGVRLRTSRAVFRAEGDSQLQRVVIGKVDRRGFPVAGTEETVEADVLCTGYGLLPSVELAVSVGCEMHYHEVRGGWLPVHDENMQTSVPGVFVAGEIAGIGGGDVAMAEGALAGRAVAIDLGCGGLELAPLQLVRRAERRSTDALLAAFPVLGGLYHLCEDDTIVCRCEDVTLAQVKRACGVFGTDIRSVKMATRAGMGPCQARMCHRIIGGLLSERLGGERQPTPCPSVRAPIKPVAVQTYMKRS